MIDPSSESACMSKDMIEGGSAQVGWAQELSSVCLRAEGEFMTCLKVSGVGYSVEVLPSALRHWQHHGSLSLSRWHWLLNTCGNRCEDTAEEQKQERGKNIGGLKLWHSQCLVWDICGGIKPSVVRFSWLTAVTTPCWNAIIIYS